MDLLAIGGVGPQEGVIVLLIVLLLFGAKRLPEIGKGLGKGIKEFRGAAKGLTDDDDDEPIAPSTGTPSTGTRQAAPPTGKPLADKPTDE